LGLVAIVALALGLALHPLAVDDAFITYRYAQNLAGGQGFVYNPGRPVLSTTAPLWALVLAAGAWLGLDLPSLANALSAVALGIAGLLVLALGRREGDPWVGFLAALLLVAYPLLWLSLGLETAAFLALGLGAVLAFQRGRPYWSAVVLALATLTRGDGLILAGVMVTAMGLARLDRYESRPPVRKDRLADYIPDRKRGFRAQVRDLAQACRDLVGALWSGPGRGTFLRAAGLYALVMLPVVAWLTWQFGSPLPATLGAKVAQSELGVTGFYAHTTYLQGLGILAHARFLQSPLYLLFLPVVGVGLLAMWRGPRWVRLLVAWGAAHLAGYTLLGVTPYYWYYAPLVPALVALAALGVVGSTRWLQRRLDRLGGSKVAAGGRWIARSAVRGVLWVLGGLWAAGLLAALLWSDGAMVRALDGPVPSPEDPVSKVLPEAKAGPYREVGLWLREHTPAGATVGVTEVGIMGYYAGRPMVDFLGILEPDVAAALARDDLYWALPRYQPDYLALTGVTPLYAYDLRADPWFQAAYRPVETVADPRFWGSPVTIYERAISRTQMTIPVGGDLPPEAVPLDVALGPIRLLGAVAGVDTAHPGDVLALTLFWKARQGVPGDYDVFVHLLGQDDRVIAQRDAPPGLGARPTGDWVPGQIVADPYLLAVPEAAYAPDQAVWEVGLYDPATGQRLTTLNGAGNVGADNVRFGAVHIVPAAAGLRLDFGPVALTGYELDRLALSAGEALHVTLHWAGDGAARTGLRLVAEDGTVGADTGGDAEDGAYALVLAEDAPPGAYDLELWLRDAVTHAPLPLLGADGQPRGDHAQLTKVRVYP
jgi:hypothetical protein